MKVFSSHVNFGPREAPPSTSLLLAAPLPIRRTGWTFSSVPGASSAASPSATTLDNSSPRIPGVPESAASAFTAPFSSSTPDPLQVQDQNQGLARLTPSMMDDSYRHFSQRRPATEGLPPFTLPQNNSAPSFQAGHGSAYLPSPSQPTPPTNVASHGGFQLPSPSQQQPPVSLANQYPLPSTSGPAYAQQHQQQQLPSPTQHSPSTASLGGQSDYQHASTAGPNYTLSGAQAYPVMAPPQHMRQPPGYYAQPMGFHHQIPGMQHPQAHMLQGHPSMQQMHYSIYGQPQPQPAMDRPFKCDQCTQSFSRNHDLKRHKRIHLSVKPFPCTFCSKQFSRKDALKRHRLVKGCEEKAKQREKQEQEAAVNNSGAKHEDGQTSQSSSNGGDDSNLRNGIPGPSNNMGSYGSSHVL